MCCACWDAFLLTTFVRSACLSYYKYPISSDQSGLSPVFSFFNDLLACRLSKHRVFFLFITPFCVRDYCVWSSLEISSFWNTHISPSDTNNDGMVTEIPFSPILIFDMSINYTSVCCEFIQCSPATWLADWVSAPGVQVIDGSKRICTDSKELARFGLVFDISHNIQIVDEAHRVLRAAIIQYKVNWNDQNNRLILNIWCYASLSPQQFTNLFL